MKGTINAAARRIFRGLLALCIGLGSYPRLVFAYGGTVVAPAYSGTELLGQVVARSDLLGQVVEATQAAKWANGSRAIGATVEVAGAARSLAAGRVGVAVAAATAAAALGTYCWKNPGVCSLDAVGKMFSDHHYVTDSSGQWAKEFDGQVKVAVFSVVGTDYYEYQTAANAWATAAKRSIKTFKTVKYYPAPNDTLVSSFMITACEIASPTSCSDYSFYSTIKTVTMTETAPATEDEIKMLPTAVVDFPSDDVLNAWPQDLSIPVNAPVVKPSVIALGDPYAGPDPATGWRQDYAQVDPKPAPAPWYDVNVTTGTGIVDNPNTDTVEGPKTVDQVDPATGDQTKPDTTETKDPGLCDMYPDILACQKMGDVPDDKVPKKTVNVEYSPESVDLPVGCPADLQLPHGQVLSYASSCQAATSARPFVIALASLSALLLVVAVVRRG